MTGINNLSDDELLILVKKDHEAAFTEIYNRYVRTLADFAGSKLYSLEDARDLLHDLFVKLWEDRHSLNITTNLKAYLFSAVRYKVIDKIRQNSTRQQYAAKEQGAINAIQYGIQDQLEAKELQLSINLSLGNLAPRTKEIFLLSRTEQLSIAEIAEKLALSEQTVKNQLSTALKHLRKSVNKDLLTAALIYLWFS